jgi:hypothetical protein
MEKRTWRNGYDVSRLFMGESSIWERLRKRQSLCKLCCLLRSELFLMALLTSRGTIVGSGAETLSKKCFCL